jgi:hypothetical protein
MQGDTSLWYVLSNEVLIGFLALSVVLISFPSVMKSLFVMFGNVLDNVSTIKTLPQTMVQKYDAERVNISEIEYDVSEVW